MTTFDALKNSSDLPQRAARWWQRIIDWESILALIMVNLLLFMPALALQAANWPLSLRLTLPVILLSTLFGFFLARSSYDELFALIVSGVYGGVIVLLVAALIQPAGIVESMSIVLARSLNWIIAAATNQINQDSLVFSMVVALLFWFFGYNAVWHIFRLDRVWRVILPPALILLVNLAVYTGDANLETYLLPFLFVSLLLIVRSNLEAREWDWYVNNVRVPQQLHQQFLWVGAGLSLVALLLAWGLPSGNLQQRLDNFQQLLASDAVRQMSEFWNRLIEPVETEGPATADYYSSDSLQLGGAIRLGDQVVMLVDVPETSYRYYWRARVHEIYQDGNWAPSATRRVPDFTPPLEVITNNEVIGGARVTIDHTVTMSIPSRLVYTVPQPLDVNLSGRLDVRRIGDDQGNTSAPMNVSVIRPQRVIEAGQSYEATGALSVATAFELRDAGTNYPDWVASPNAYPAGINPRVASLAQQIVTDAGATNPYDQAKALETWLRTNIAYNEQIPSPPPGVDPVEWFLFDQLEGYCTYYATAMIQMLRSLQIPARLATGFAQGEFDPSVGEYVVRERDAHTWVEVYFPGYGWVEFEPTAAQAPLTREGDNVQPQSASQPPEPTPAPTNTPLPTPTPQATSTPENQASNPPDTSPTITPTSTPTPTATAVIVPTEQPPVQPPEPPPSNFLSFLGRALGIAAMLLASVIALVLLLLFIYWWWEWRGMRDLTPVVRSYARLERYLGLIGLRSSEDKTPEERRKEIIRRFPQAERPVTVITRAYTIEKYSQRRDTPQASYQSDLAAEAWQTVRRLILMRWVRRLIPFVKEQ